MGLNFYCACHLCKTRLFLYRGEESELMHRFWKDHSECIKFDKDACVIQGDGYSEQNWMSEYEPDDLQL